MVKTNIQTHWQTKSPFSVITLEFDHLPVEEAKSIIDAMNFPPGPITSDIKRTAFNSIVKENTVVVTIFYEHTHEGEYYRAIRCRAPIDDAEKILEALKMALRIFEEKESPVS